jgi:DNA-binding NtrC family response regulator
MRTKPRILVIEDDKDIQDIMVAFFKPRNYEVVTYDDAEEVLNDFMKQRTDFDVIITDLKLPKMSGIELTKNIKNLGIDIPIILMTAHKGVETAAEAVEAGAYDFVVKPLHFPQLLVSVERALHLNTIKMQNTTLKAVLQTQEGSAIDGIIGKSPGFRQALDLAKRVSSSNANIFISGESGTGKEVIAKAIHNLGIRKKQPFVAINCSAIPENLLESELFGHAKGSFTGASEKKVGLFEEAGDGTLFLDEIGDLSLPLQAKLLRVLQERKIKRIGENQYRPINARIISATHKDLRSEVANHRFREDLFFRLNVIPIKIPPLRDRKEDIIPLSEFFLKKYTALNNSPAKSFSKGSLEKLLNSSWKGNVRELENTIERAVVLCTSAIIQAEDLTDTEIFESALPLSGAVFDFRQLTGDKILTIDEIVKLYIQHVLNLNHGAKEKTAKDLSIDRKTLYRKLQEMEKQPLSPMGM